jgi:hypothetical protein
LWSLLMFDAFLRLDPGHGPQPLTDRAAS